MGKESVDCRFGQERGGEELERGRGGVKAEYIMELDSSGRGEGKCSAVGECGRGPVGRRQIGISHLFPPFSSLNFKQFPSTLAPRTLLRALRTLSRFSHPQCRFLPLSPTCISRCRAAKKCPTRRLLPRFCNLSNPGEPYLTRSNPNPNPNRHLGMNKAEM